MTTVKIMPTKLFEKAFINCDRLAMERSSRLVIRPAISLSK